MLGPWKDSMASAAVALVVGWVGQGHSTARGLHLVKVLLRSGWQNYLARLCELLGDCFYLLFFFRSCLPS